MVALCDASLVRVTEFVAETDELVVSETLLLRLCSGLFDVDGEEDDEMDNVEDVHVDMVGDNVTRGLCDVIPESEVLAHADS